jgi:hypothetical protein
VLSHVNTLYHSEMQTLRVAFHIRLVLAGQASAPQKVFIIMLGGCTLAELTAARAVSEHVGLQPVFLTTDIITGDRLVRSFMPDPARLASADAKATMSAL